MFKKLILLLLVIVFHSDFSFAQRKPREEDILFKTQLIRSIDLNWKTSKDIFGEDKIIPVILFEAAMRGEIIAYADNKLETELSQKQLLDKVSICEFDTCYQYIEPSRFNELELGEDLVFDARRSEHYFIPKFLAVYIPENLNYRGLKEPLAVFKYEDCEKVFRKDERAFSQNQLIGGRKINFADLFMMKCFYNELVKVGHANDAYFDQKYSGKVEAFLQSKESENRLADMLYRLYNPQ